MTKNLVIFAATVPWRKRACDEMLASFAKQSRMPDEVYLHLDGYDEGDELPVIPAALNVKSIRLSPRQGVGARWRSLKHVSDDTTVVGADDDFVYGKTYLQETVEALEMHGGAVSWHGFSPSWENMCFQHHVAEASPLVRVGTAFLCTVAGRLKGVESSPLAGVFFSVEGHEEALIAYWLWDHGVVATRPTGKAPVIKHHELGCDRRSTSKSFPERKAELRRRLFREFGWPGGRQKPPDPKLLLRQFEAAAKQFFQPYKSRNVSLAGIIFIQKQVQSWCEKKGGPIDFLELGAGYSTMCLAGFPGVRLTSVDHNQEWAEFVERELGVELPVLPRKKMSTLGVFDAVLVDQGPDMDTRIFDLPWICRHVSPGGRIIFDDWTARFSLVVEEALAKLPGDWSVETVGGQCFKKSVAVVVRKAEVCGVVGRA